MQSVKTRSGFRKVLQDPLIHFLILGGVLFFSAPLWKQAAAPKGEIRISQAGQKHLADLFTLTWQRPPSEDELKNLIEDHIKEEIYYREALALGLDENDTIVRRRMRQKLEFMQEDLSGAQEASLDDLRAYFTANQDKYKTDRVLSFRQVLVSTKRVGTDALAIKTIKELQAGTDPSSLTRSSLLPISMKLETEKSVSNIFGDDFLAGIGNLKSGQWAGPIHSAFGTHIVFIQLDQKSTPLDFEAALPKLKIDYMQKRRAISAETYYQSLRKGYSIIIDNTQ